MRIYVASSWRNETQQNVVKELRSAGHQVYDFKNPPGGTGFSWSEIDPNWLEWTNKEFVNALAHPIAERGFNSDFDAMQWADACVLVLPCGRSAHSEAGWMQGSGKPTFIFSPGNHEPELMYKMFEKVCTTLDEVTEGLKDLERLKVIKRASVKQKIAFNERVQA